MARKQPPPKQQKSFAARFRVAFEQAERGETPPVPDRHPSIFAVRQAEESGGLSYAAQFRRVFEEAERQAGAPEQEGKALAYYGPGKPAVTAINGVLRYLYEDGSVDRGSTVDLRTSDHVVEVAIATQVEIESEVEIDMAGTDEPAGAQAAETGGQLAVKEAMAA